MSYDICYENKRLGMKTARLPCLRRYRLALHDELWRNRNPWLMLLAQRGRKVFVALLFEEFKVCDSATWIFVKGRKRLTRPLRGGSL
jgi:hypothetical protein